MPFPKQYVIRRMTTDDKKDDALYHRQSMKRSSWGTRGRNQVKRFSHSGSNPPEHQKVATSVRSAWVALDAHAAPSTDFPDFL